MGIIWGWLMVYLYCTSWGLYRLEKQKKRKTAEKQNSEEAVKQRSRKAKKQRSRERKKSRKAKSREAEQRRSIEAKKHKSRIQVIGIGEANAFGLNASNDLVH